MPDQTYQTLPDYDDDTFCRLVEDHVCLRHDRGDIYRATSRYDFARFASMIAEDRYSGGSTAAQLAVAIMLKFGLEAAVNFAKDIQHHEG